MNPTIAKTEVLKETGLVTRIEAGVAWVNTQSRLACSSCKVESTCGNSLLEKYLAGKIFVSKIPNQLGAKVGDQVEIEVPKASVTKASLLVYWLPLAGLIGGALLGDYWLQTENAAIAFGFAGLAGALAWLARYSRKLNRDPAFIPRMVTKNGTNYSAQAFESIEVKNL